VKTVGTGYKVFVGAAVVAGAGVVFGLSGGGGGVDPTLESTSNLLLWMALVTIAATSPFPLPRSSATTTLTPVLDVAGFILFGPALGIAFAVLARLLSFVVERSQSLWVLLSAVSRAMLTLALASLFYAWAGGRFGSGALIGSDALVALATGACAYWLVKSVLGLADTALCPARGRRAGSSPLATSLREQVVVDAVLVPFGVLLALVQLRLSLVGVALFLVPLLLGRYLFKHWVETKRAQTKLVRTLMAALDAVDPFTRGHSYRIAAMSVRVGRHLGMSPRELEELELAALLHDVGRAAIRHEIRLKPGRLTRSEQTQLQAHPQIAHDLLAELPSLAGAAEIVLAHHEQPDGKGYPRALSAEQIPLGSRIIMAVAAFDAMTSDRPYRQGLAPQAAFDELLAHSGTQFFAEVVEALIQLHSNGALFEDFAPEQLEEYADGRGNSRALEEYAQSRATTPGGVPAKLGVDAGASGARADGSDDGAAQGPRIPMLELAGDADEPSAAAATTAAAATAQWAESEDELELEAPEAWQGVTLEAGENAGTLRVFAVTDVGCTRKNNEDCYGLFTTEGADGDCLVVLADGMGGAASGEIASRLAVATVARELRQTKHGGASPRVLARALETANRAIHERANANVEHRGMGTTCTAAWWSEGAWQWAHVGDSRAYLVKEGLIEQLTRDHTLATELEGRQVANEGAVSSAHHVLTRNLGSADSVEVDTSGSPLALEPGEALVLCSDGLSNLVEDAEIGEIVASGDPEEACRFLVELARARGGPDNITIVIAKAG
jgi:serine/threonine protein phosphatase PrpC